MLTLPPHVHTETRTQPYTPPTHTHTLNFFHYSRYISLFISKDVYLQSGYHTENTVMIIKHYSSPPTEPWQATKLVHPRYNDLTSWA